MYKVKLTKVRSNHKNLRTDEIFGETAVLPMKGKVFVLIGEGLEFGIRFISTTPVLEIEQMGKVCIFQTTNSTYKLEVFGE